MGVSRNLMRIVMKRTGADNVRQTKTKPSKSKEGQVHACMCGVAISDDEELCTKCREREARNVSSGVDRIKIPPAHQVRYRDWHGDRRPKRDVTYDIDG
ncbi:MAG: hypothetical protein UZ22_OP11002001098 [Microgenomates bacterium OLB23]|nr:MAG: hypothetical protein UZ22_OP11002001098 [Microgenomates bacterium OLB23]